MKGRAITGIVSMVVVAAVTATIALGSANPTQAQAPGNAAVITFITALCPAESAMAVAVTGGSDPTSRDNGTTEAVPADIAAYGCEQAALPYHLYLLAGSTRSATYLDPGLDSEAVINRDDSAWDGTATVIGAGESYYAPAGRPATRRLSLAEFNHPGTSWVGLPFLDLQCYADGANNDNGDGVGWNNLSLNGGQQVYCIAYFAADDPEPAPAPANESAEEAAAVASDGAVSKELHPDVKVDEEGGVVTWIIRLVERGERIYVWDDAVETCQGFGGAICGGIGSDDDPGTFNPGQANDQHLVVTQSFSVEDGQCDDVANTVQWSTKRNTTPGDRESLTATYRCSGASVLGWPLLVVAFGVAASAAWVIHRRAPWRKF